LQAVGLDELSQGRFLLGVGVSNPTIGKWHGASVDRPLARVSEYLDIVQRAMRGEKLNFDGEFFSAHEFKLAFKPPRKPVPLYLAAFGPMMSRLAGKLTDGVLINMANPGEIRRIVDQARQGAKEAGKDPDALEIICKARCSVASTHAEAREALSHALTFYALADYYRNLLGRMGFAAEVEAMYSAWKSGGFHAARALITGRMFEGLPLIPATSVPEIQERMRAFREAGATRMILPYVAASEDVVGEIRNFISGWKPQAMNYSAAK
jgi:alkanesulfonate monooxygenase SsuD/methylene tetrahydromethanopterin reductase-like flavin-dependent oxidoreductase (luciferase family)